MSTKPPVLVIGAGPVGLIFTLCMLKNGVPVRLIERNTAFHGGARGTALQPRTLEAFAFLGILDEVLDTATDPLLLANYGPDGHTTKYTKWSEEADRSPGIPYPSLASTSQASLEEVLRTHIRKLGGTVETGIELIGLEQDDDKVTARLSRHDTEKEETVECAFLIGADGAKGRTRKLLGIPFLGETKESERLFSANVYATGAPREYWNIWGNFGTAGVGLKPLNPEPLFQLQSLGPNLPAVLPTDLEGIRELFHSISGRTDIQIHAVDWASEWRANIRMAERFGEGRVFLVGDAAHCHSPFGGQGTNSGIQDAVNLAWKLSLVYGARAPLSLLSTYDVERIPVIAQMLDLSTAIHSRAYNRLKSSALDSGTQSVDTADVLLRPRHLLQLGVNYRWSPIVLEGRALEANERATERNPYGQDSDRVQAGDRAPDAPGLVRLSFGEATAKAVTLFSLFDVRRHLVLVLFSGNVARVQIDLSGLYKYQGAGRAEAVIILHQHATMPGMAVKGESVGVFVDSEGHAWKQYGLEDPESTTTFAVVRPDGVIGAFTLSLDGVHQYFLNLLCEPAFPGRK